jgi:hypothetical protein
VQLTSDFPSVHEQDIHGPHQRGSSQDLYGQYIGGNTDDGGTLEGELKGVLDPSGEQVIPQTREMQV